MLDETVKSLTKILKQTQEIFRICYSKNWKKDGCDFCNERSHELNLEYRITDRPTDVIS